MGGETTEGAVALSAYDQKHPFPFRPCLRGDWKDLDAREAAAVIAGLAEAAGQPLLRMRALPLAFYPDAVLCEATFDLDDNGEPAMLQVVATPAARLVLDGQSTGIHELNAEAGLVLNDATRAGYLEFFCNTIRGEAGTFRIVRDGADLDWTAAAEDALKQAAADKLAPLREEGPDPETEGARRFSATVCYDRRLYNVVLSVARNGGVRMLDDTEIDLGQGEDPLPLQPEAFRGPFRLAG